MSLSSTCEFTEVGTLNQDRGAPGLYRGMNFSPVLVLKDIESKDELPIEERHTHCAESCCDVGHGHASHPRSSEAQSSGWCAVAVGGVRLQAKYQHTH